MWYQLSPEKIQKNLLQHFRGIKRQNSDAIEQKNIEEICAVKENSF